MQQGKYDKQVKMVCIVCNHDQFEQSDDSDLVKCVSCGREVTKDTLLAENSEHIDAEIESTAEHFNKDLEKELGDVIKNAFKGVKGFKVK